MLITKHLLRYCSVRTVRYWSAAIMWLCQQWLMLPWS